MGGDKLLSVAHSSKQTNRTRTEKGSSRRAAAEGVGWSGTGTLYTHTYANGSHPAACPRQLKWLQLSDVMPTTIWYDYVKRSFCLPSRLHSTDSDSKANGWAGTAAGAEAEARAVAGAYTEAEATRCLLSLVIGVTRGQQLLLLLLLLRRCRRRHALLTDFPVYGLKGAAGAAVARCGGCIQFSFKLTIS